MTELTSKAVGAWLVGIGATAATIAWRDDDEDVHRAALAYPALGGLAAAGIARYGHDVRWSEAATPAYLVLVASWLVMGLAGALRTLKAGRFVTCPPRRASFITVQIGRSQDAETVDLTAPREAVAVLDFLNADRPSTVVRK